MTPVIVTAKESSGLVLLRSIADDDRQDENQPYDAHHRSNIVAVGFFKNLTDDGDDDADGSDFEKYRNIHNLYMMMTKIISPQRNPSFKYRSPYLVHSSALLRLYSPSVPFTDVKYAL